MRLSVLAVAVLLAGCALNERTSEPLAQATQTITPRVGGTWQDNLRNAALLSAMVYGASPDHELRELGGGEGLRALMPGLSVARRLVLFAHQGLPAEYFAPRLWIMPWVRHPEVYVIGNPADQSLNIVFVGSNDLSDWYQNAKASVYEDDGEAGDPFIPSGHAGFRRGVTNLIDSGFFSDELPELCRAWGIRPGADGRVPVFVSGHSLGAAIAQLSLPVLDGWHHTGERAVDGAFVIERGEGLFSVRGVHLIAPPYAIASDEYLDEDLPPERWRRDAAVYEWMVRTYGGITWNVIHDADVVCSVYDFRKVHEVSMKHFGRLVRIDGNGQARIEETSWRNQRPHDYWSYWRSLRTLPR